MEQDKYIHVRYVTFTEIFHNHIKELGFEVSLDEGHGLKRRLEFKKNNKKVISTFERLILMLEHDKKKPLIQYQGLTVSKDLLDFFANREPITINKNENRAG